MNRLAKNILLGGLLPLLLAALFASCDDEMLDTGKNASSDKMGSVSFRLGGISGNVPTRSSGDTVSIDLSQYAVKAFVFRYNPDNSELQYYKEQDVTQSLVTITEITKDVNHAYVFVAVPKWAESYLNLKCYPKNVPTKMQLSTDGKSVTQAGTSYKECYIPVFREPNVDADNNLQGDKKFQVITNPETGEDFKIYAWGNETPVGHGNDTYTPDLVIFAPQFGKVRFKANAGQTISSCNIYSNVYRFYMSQVIGNNPTVENGLVFTTSWDAEVYNDFLANYESDGNQTCITKTFTPGSSYEVCMPCTTLGTEEPTNLNELANTYGLNTAWEGQEDDIEEGQTWLTPTSATVNDKIIATKKTFPIFRKRTTVLGIKDENTMTVTFEDENKKPGIGLDDDEWNGLVNN